MTVPLIHHKAAADLDFEAAAELRDQMLELKTHLEDVAGDGKNYRKNIRRKKTRKRKEYGGKGTEIH